MASETAAMDVSDAGDQEPQLMEEGQAAISASAATVAATNVATSNTSSMSVTFPATTTRTDSSRSVPETSLPANNYNNNRSSKRVLRTSASSNSNNNNNSASASSTNVASNAATVAASTTTTTTGTAPSRLRNYKSNTSANKWVTREIAALEFLLGIPMEAEQRIVHQGWLQHQQGMVNADKIGNVSGVGKSSDDEETKTELLLEPPSSENVQPSSFVANSSNHHGRWWEKWINNPSISKTDALSSRQSGVEGEELEQPNEIDDNHKNATATQPLVPVVYAPGRRLEGDKAVLVQIPLTGDRSVITRQRVVARMAVTREWELKVAHGIGGETNTKTTTTTGGAATNNNSSRHSRTIIPAGNRPTTAPSASTGQVHPPLLDGRLFFSAAGSYPHQVFSLLRYEPKKEEAARRRQKLEARGGGGTEFFIMPMRDWRGISYRALLPPRHFNSSGKSGAHDIAGVLFDRFASNTETGLLRRKRRHKTPKGGEDPNNPKTTESTESEEDEDEEDDDEDLEEEEEGADTYVAGLLDDPEMVQGRHRTVMIGDRGTGCIVSSTIQFVKPELLKADLNKQFRERFDGWEPPKSQRKYIGARVIDGLYTLLDPSSVQGDEDTGTVGTNDDDSKAPTITTMGSSTTTPRNRGVSTGSVSTVPDAAETIIRMPPSLTLSKIRSVKRQALLAAVKAKLEISTVALAIVYFERLCLDCRVDKSNRRLSFAACLLLAIKFNEAHVGLVIANDQPSTTKNNPASKMYDTTRRIQSLIRPTKKTSDAMFATLLEFFTQEWNISLKHLFAAEWGVLASLQFRLHAKPSQVSFHFKRLLKSLDWNPRRYLGGEMYDYWQDALSTEEYLRQEREVRREKLKQKKEQKKLLRIQRELEAANRREESNETSNNNPSTTDNDEDNNDNGGDKEDKLKKKNSEPDLSKLLDFETPLHPSPKRINKKGSGIGGILNRFGGGKRALSSDKLLAQAHQAQAASNTMQGARSVPVSPSLPTLSFSSPRSSAHKREEVSGGGHDIIIDIPHLSSNRTSQSDGEESSIRSNEDGAIII